MQSFQSGSASKRRKYSDYRGDSISKEGSFTSRRSQGSSPSRELHDWLTKFMEDENYSDSDSIGKCSLVMTESDKDDSSNENEPPRKKKKEKEGEKQDKRVENTKYSHPITYTPWHYTTTKDSMRSEQNFLETPENSNMGIGLRRKAEPSKWKIRSISLTSSFDLKQAYNSEHSETDDTNKRGAFNQATSDQNDFQLGVTTPPVGRESQDELLQPRDVSKNEQRVTDMDDSPSGERGRRWPLSQSLPKLFPEQQQTTKYVEKGTFENGMSRVPTNEDPDAKTETDYQQMQNQLNGERACSSKSTFIDPSDKLKFPREPLKDMLLENTSLGTAGSIGKRSVKWSLDESIYISPATPPNSWPSNEPSWTITPSVNSQEVLSRLQADSSIISQPSLQSLSLSPYQSLPQVASSSLFSNASLPSTSSFQPFLGHSLQLPPHLLSNTDPQPSSSKAQRSYQESHSQGLTPTPTNRSQYQSLQTPFILSSQPPLQSNHPFQYHLSDQFQTLFQTPLHSPAHQPFELPPHQSLQSNNPYQFPHQSIQSNNPYQFPNQTLQIPFHPPLQEPLQPTPPSNISATFTSPVVQLISQDESTSTTTWEDPERESEKWEPPHTSLRYEDSRTQRSPPSKLHRQFRDNTIHLERVPEKEENLLEEDFCTESTDSSDSLDAAEMERLRHRYIVARQKFISKPPITNKHVLAGELKRSMEMVWLMERFVTDEYGSVLSTDSKMAKDTKSSIETRHCPTLSWTAAIHKSLPVQREPRSSLKYPVKGMRVSRDSFEDQDVRRRTSPPRGVRRSLSLDELTPFPSSSSSEVILRSPSILTSPTFPLTPPSSPAHEAAIRSSAGVLAGQPSRLDSEAMLHALPDAWLLDGSGEEPTACRFAEGGGPPSFPRRERPQSNTLLDCIRGSDPRAPPVPAPPLRIPWSPAVKNVKIEVVKGTDPPADPQTSSVPPSRNGTTSTRRSSRPSERGACGVASAKEIAEALKIWLPLLSLVAPVPLIPRSGTQGGSRVHKRPKARGTATRRTAARAQTKPRKRAKSSAPQPRRCHAQQPSCLAQPTRVAKPRKPWED